MHSVPLERKLKLPDPSKAIEAAWKLLRRTRQQVNTAQGRMAVHVSGSAPGEILSEKKRARIEAERQKGRGMSYALRNTMR